MPEVSCFDLVKVIALNLSGLTIMQLLVNQSIAKPDLLLSEFISPDTVSLTDDMVLSSAKLKQVKQIIYEDAEENCTKD